MLKRILLGLICGWGLSALFLISVSLVAPPPGEGRDIDIVRQARLPGVPVPSDPAPAPQAEVAATEPSIDPADADEDVAAAPDVAAPADRVPLPPGSQFNSPAADRDMASAEGAGGIRPTAPVAAPQLEDAPTVPRAQTATVAQPKAVQTVTSANAPEAGEAPAIPATASDGAPLTFRDGRIAEVESALPATQTVETEPAEPSVAATPVLSEVAPDVGAETAPVLAQSPASDVAPEGPATEATNVAVAPAPEPVAAPEPGDPPASDEPAIARVVPAEPEDAQPEVTETESVDAPAEVETTPEAVVEAETEEPASGDRAESVPVDDVDAPGIIIIDEATDPADADGATEQASNDAEGEAGTEAETGGIRILRTDRPLAQPGVQGTSTEEAETPPATGGTLPRRLILDSERAAPAEEVVTAEPEVPAPADQPALRAHASPFENPDNLPLLAVVLVADGDAAPQVEFPATVAVDGAAAEASRIAQTQRDAGREVMLLADALAMDGTPQDVEIALAGARNAVPQAVGVLDRPEGGFATNRDALSGLLPALADAGMGFLTYPTGLGSGLSNARREGVAAAPVLRRIEAVGEGLNAMDRVLTRAAFEAARDGSAVVVVTATPEIITLLSDWAQGPEADGVALAPISAVLGAAAP